MRDFFESRRGESAAEVFERGIPSEETHLAQRRKVISAAIALSVVGAVVLGGGMAALGSALGPVSQPTLVSAATSTSSPGHALKKKPKAKKAKRSAKKPA